MSTDPSDSLEFPLHLYPWEAYCTHGRGVVPCVSEASARNTASNLSSVIVPWRARERAQP